MKFHLISTFHFSWTPLLGFLPVLHFPTPVFYFPYMSMKCEYDDEAKAEILHTVYDARLLTSSDVTP